jgi:hemolysin activation/secretion protein
MDVRQYTPFVVIVIIALLSAMPCIAQISASEQAVQRDIQQRNQQQKLLEQQRRERTRLPLTSTVFEEISKETDMGACFTLNQLVIEGAEWLNDGKKNDLREVWLGRCISQAQVNQILKRITAYYFDAGYITSRAYIPQQTLADGVLKIIVVEGKVEALKINDDTDLSLLTAFPGAEGDQLNLRDLEQGLEQINRLASCHAQMNLVPGDDYGASIVDVDAGCKRTYHLRLGRNNGGQASTGEQQQSVSVNWDNASGLNDYLSLSYQGDTGGSKIGSDSLSAHWDVPLGYWLFLVDVSRFKYQSLVQGSFSVFETSGESSNQTLTAEHTLRRTRNNKTKLALSVSRKDNKNYIENVLIDTSSRTLAVSELSLKHEHYAANGDTWVGRVAYIQGHKGFGSPDDDKTASNSPKAQFASSTFSLDYSHAWSTQSSSIQYQANFFAQHSDDRLFGVEQINIGSEYTVRGYKEAGLSSNTGGYWRNTLSTTLSTPWGNSWLQYIKPSLSLDVGVIRDRIYSTAKYTRLKGGAAGVQLGGRWFNLNLLYAKAIDAPSFLPVSKEQWHFTMNFTY